MTEIQRLAIPAILQGGDVIAKSRTGSGKTLAFLIPAIEMVVNTLKNKESSERRGVYVLVIVPTHELAMQTFNQARKLLRDHQYITVGVSMGGAELSNEIELFTKQPHILIVTPGRFAEHIHLRNMRARDFASLKLLVFDEADRILDMGWKIEISRIMSALPESRQTVLFGATVSSESVNFSGIKSTALFISASDQLTNENCVQEYKPTTNESLLKDLSSLLNQHKGKKTIVFFQTVKIAELFSHIFGQAGWAVKMLHGRMDQTERSTIFNDFMDSKFDVLFSTNVAARGLDFVNIPNVEVILQVGIPEDMEEYIHRIGRTARAGESGKAVLLARPYELFFVDKLRESKIQVKEINLESAPSDFGTDFAHYDQPAIVSYLGYLAGNKDFLSFVNIDVVREVKDFVRGMNIRRINVNLSVLEKLKLPLDSFRPISQRDREREGERRRDEDRRRDGDRWREGDRSRDGDRWREGERRRDDDRSRDTDRRREGDRWQGERRRDYNTRGDYDNGDRRRDNDRRVGDRWQDRKREYKGDERVDRYDNRRDNNNRDENRRGFQSRDQYSNNKRDNNYERDTSKFGNNNKQEEREIKKENAEEVNVEKETKADTEPIKRKARWTA